MAVTTTMVLSTLSALSAVSSISGGMSANSAAVDQSANAIADAEARAVESQRVSFKEAQAEQEAADQTARRQKVAFLSSGVDLAGSPLLLMEETRRKGAENVEEVLAGGKAQAAAQQSEGRAQASRLEASGQSALMGGFASGLSTAASGYQSYQSNKKVK